jgi:hypothetical protein
VAPDAVRRLTVSIGVNFVGPWAVAAKTVNACDARPSPWPAIRELRSRRSDFLYVRRVCLLRCLSRERRRDDLSHLAVAVVVEMNAVGRQRRLALSVSRLARGEKVHKQRTALLRRIRQRIDVKLHHSRPRRITFRRDGRENYKLCARMQPSQLIQIPRKRRAKRR